jgi:hypothetical protein
MLEDLIIFGLAVNKAPLLHTHFVPGHGTSHPDRGFCVLDRPLSSYWVVFWKQDTNDSSFLLLSNLQNHRLVLYDDKVHMKLRHIHECSTSAWRKGTEICRSRITLRKYVAHIQTDRQSEVVFLPSYKPNLAAITFKYPYPFNFRTLSNSCANYRNIYELR